MPKRKHRRWNQTDNSYPGLKLRLRESYLEKVECRLVFDLFAGHGTMASALYIPRAEHVVCVDGKRDALADIPQAPNVHIYCGDNRGLVLPLIREYGGPDFVDLDAYGNPDTVLTRLLRGNYYKQRMAVVATDGTFTSRQRAAPIPACWGYGKCKWAPQSLRMRDYPALIYANLQRWAAGTARQVAEFDSYLVPGTCVVYWGALLEAV